MPNLTAKLYIYRLVDIADKLDLARLKRHLRKMKPKPLRLSHFTPTYLNFSVPPIETSEKSWQSSVSEKEIKVKLKFYSLGSLTIKFEIDLDGRNYSEIFEKARCISNNNDVFDKKARDIAKTSRDLVEKHLGINAYSGFAEDYAILWIKSEAPAIDNETKDVFTRFLRNEPSCLSIYEQSEALRHSFSYTPQDLTVIDWDRAITIGEKPEEDVWDVLEYANLQLLELRYYESELDKRLKEIYAFSTAERFPFFNLYRTQSMLQKNLRIYVEFTKVENKINNFLQLTGDEYLSRIYMAASSRLNMKRTQENLRERLIDAKELYEMLSAEASSLRAEILEIIIILLIVFEIVMPFVKS